MTLCCVLPYLVDRELRELNTARLRENPLQPAVEDPMLAIENIIIATLIVVCGRLLSWYSNVQRSSMSKNFSDEKA